MSKPGINTYLNVITAQTTLLSNQTLRRISVLFHRGKGPKNAYLLTAESA